jgi:YopX protein
MREVKFRAWDGKQIVEDAGLLRSDGDAELAAFDNDCPVVWLQFTGLRDAKGVEIFQGDIFIVGTEPWVVSWDEGDAGFWLTQPHGTGRLNLGMVCGEGEVAGNAYGNGDLLPEVQSNLAI